MFVGHYGPSFGGRAAAAAPLWLFFVAAQFLDYLWGVFILLGVERMRIVDGFLPMSPFDLFYMPWTHSLVMAVVWSAVFAGLARFALGVRSSGALLLLALAVFSHWVLDLLVHAPDLALWPTDDAPKLGLAAWRDPALTLLLEFGVLFAGFALYMGATRARGVAGRIGPFVLLLILIGLFAYNHYAPVPPNSAVAAGSALAAYTVLAVLAWLLCDRLRTAK
ncbi:MAG: hypothetical protein K2Q06_04915 [Parvularculaceae bacterium]|nr:hypothetical protein [Parvularculaceae bacterium]